MGRGIAYTKVRELVRLATALQASSVGLTMKQMMEGSVFSLSGLSEPRSRKTIKRMLDGLFDLGLKPKISSVEGDHHLVKRWRLDTVPSALLALEPTERSSLERLNQALQGGVEKQALTKVLADHKPLSQHLAIDQEMLIEREAYIGKVGPRSQVDETLMLVVERALKGFEEVKILYRAAAKPKATWRTVRPLGMLFSRFGYLVASSGDRTPVTYRLDLIQKAELAGIYFEARHDFDFKEWASESFGVFHGDEVFDVKLRFNKVAAQRAAKVQFHPSQTTQKGRSGSFLVQLKCQGHRELIHELLHPDWLGFVTIEEPEELKVEYLRYLTASRMAVT